MSDETKINPPFWGGMSFEDYLAFPAISSGFIRDLMRSPFHAKHRAAEKDTPAMQMGRAIHCAILEPHVFERRYQPYVKARNPKHSEYQTWLIENPNVEALRPDDYDHAHRIADAVHGHPAVSALLQEGQAEQTAIAEVNDILCRCRPDWIAKLSGGDLVHVSLKTCQSASPWDFGRTYHNMAYHIPDRFYELVLAAAGKPVVGTVVIAIERDPPYAVQPYELESEPPPYEFDDETPMTPRTSARDMADRILDALFNRLRICMATDHWPGYSEGLEVLRLPEYAYRSVA